MLIRLHVAVPGNTAASPPVLTGAVAVPLNNYPTAEQGYHTGKYTPIHYRVKKDLF